MGWKDELQDASFRGVQFECTATNDAASKSLAIKQAPYSNKAAVEDMGNDPRKISIDAIYVGEDYKIWLDALEAALLATGSGELIHPIYGVKQVNVASYNVAHAAEEVDSCKISIEFIQAEDKERPLFIPVAVSIPLFSIPDSPITALQSVLKKLQQFNPNKFFSFVNKIRDGINSARQFLGAVKSTIENVLSPDWIVGLIDDATRLVTFDTNISAISKWRDVFKRIQRFEKLFQNDDDTPKVMQQTWRAVQVATAVAVTQQVIATVRKEMSENKTVSFTPIELAVIRQANRKLLQQAISSERALIAGSSNVQNNNVGINVEDDATASEVIFIAMTQIQVYKQLADQIHLQIQELIEVRPPITKTQILVPCTLHWLAHSLYGDMNRADEIRRLNPDLFNPAVLQVGMELTVYAR